MHMTMKNPTIKLIIVADFQACLLPPHWTASRSMMTAGMNRPRPGRSSCLIFRVAGSVDRELLFGWKNKVRIIRVTAPSRRLM